MARSRVPVAGLIAFIRKPTGSPRLNWLFSSATIEGLSPDFIAIVASVMRDWYSQPNSTVNNLNGVCFLPDGRRGWAVGDAGTIVRTTTAGASWGNQASSTAFNLNDVWFTTDQTGFAVGHGGTVMRTRNAGATWTRLVNTGANANLFNLYLPYRRG